MAIQAYNGSNVNQMGSSEFPLINNNGGFGLGINHQQQQQQQQALFQHRSQSFLNAQIEKQRQEIDQFMRSQNERLRYMLQEQRKGEMEMMLRKMETKAFVLMRQKEEEMSKALNKNMELEDLLRKMETENQIYQRMARDNEAMVATLNSTLEQVKERALTAATCENHVEDEGSFCGGGGESFPAMKSGGCCWNCGKSGETRVLFLPCRHLCCCVGCEEGLVVCPICNAPKKNRIEALINF